MAVTARTLRLEQEIRDELAKITDQQVRDLTAAWVDGWNEVVGDLRAVLLEMLLNGDRVTRAQMLRSQRLRTALALIAANLQKLAKDAGVRISADMQAVIDTAGGAQASVVDSQLPPNAPQLVDLDAWSKVDEKQVTAIVKRSTEQITSLARPLSAEAYQAVRRELIRGVAAGTNPRATAGRMVARAEGGFNGGLTRALTIARTETLDAHRTAAQFGQAQHTDVLKGWVWTAALSSRTCPACYAMHGTEHALDEPGPQGHQQCRCSRVPLTKSWADLGITGVEEPPSLLPDAGKFFEGLPAADQRGILGPNGYDAWRRGEFPMDRWATRRSTDGWRDSYVPAKPPSSQRRSAVA